MSGILSQIAGFANRFSDELINPTNGLGKLGMYLGAASGSPLGQAQYAAHQDALKAGDSDLERQYKMAQIAHLNAPASNDTVNDYNFWKQTLSPDQFSQWLGNKINPPHFAIGPNGQMMMIGGYIPPTAQQSPPDTLPPDFDFGGGK